MTGPIQEVKQKQTHDWTQEEIRQELTQLQQWEQPAEGQTAEEQRNAFRTRLIQRDEQANAQMQAEAQEHLPQAQAQEAAAGAPVQEQAPARLTYKQRRERRRREREARRHVPDGTAETYDLAHTVTRMIKSRDASLKDIPVVEGVDRRVLAVFCQDYKLNRRGRPATREDQAKADDNRAFLTAYNSKELEQRKPYLDRFYKELSDFPINADIISDSYILSHTEQLKNICERACYFENIVKDPINAPYFNNELTQTERAVMDQKMALFAQIGTYLTNFVASRSVNINNGEYYGAKMAHAVASYREIAAATKDDVQQAVSGWNTLYTDTIRAHLDDEIQDARTALLADLEKNVREQTDHRPENVNFAQHSAGYAADELIRYRDEIMKRPEVYAAHRDAIRTLYHHFYQGLDILNDLALNGMIIQNVVDMGAEGQSKNKIRSSISKYAFDHLMRNMDDMSPAQNHLSGVLEALNFYVKGKELTDRARDILNGLGLGQDAEAVLQSRNNAQDQPGA